MIDELVDINDQEAFDAYKRDCKVRDHCHLSGEYRGAAHASCNLKVRTNYKIPVFFYN